MQDDFITALLTVVFGIIMAGPILMVPVMLVIYSIGYLTALGG